MGQLPAAFIHTLVPGLIIIKASKSASRGLRLSTLRSKQQHTHHNRKWEEEQGAYRGEELPAQAEFDQEPEEQAATEKLEYREEATDPDVGIVLDLWVEERGAMTSRM